MSPHPTILITGATDGIGLALARRYQAQAARLILVGRRPLADLDAAFFNPANYCQVDLADSDCATQLLSWLHENSVATLDLLIHNAGIGYVGAVAAQTPANIQALMAVNLQAPLALTHALLPYVEAARGKLVFISSVAAALPGPNYAVYTATKAALDGFVRNLQIELAAQKRAATAQLIHPGPTRTGMHAKSGADPRHMQWEKFPAVEDVAAKIVQAIHTKQRSVTIGFTNRLAYWAGRNLAGPVDWGMTLFAPAPLPNLPLAPRLAEKTQQAALTAFPLAERPAETLSRQPRAPHCLITGAADGIGRALALAFAAAGYTITGIDIDAERAMRTQAELQNSGAAARFAIADLAKATDIAKVVATLAERPPIDVLIHNAGINAVGPFATADLNRQLLVLKLNLTAPLLLTAALLRQNQLAQGGSLVFISSLSHFVSYPGAAVYAASKDGLAAYARSLAVALAPQNIHVLTVYPGPTRTEHARRYSPDNSREHRRMPPEKLARQILAAVQSRQSRLIPGFGNRIMALLGRLWPGVAEQAMRRTIFDKLEP